MVTMVTMFNMVLGLLYLILIVTYIRAGSHLVVGLAFGVMFEVFGIFVGIVLQ